MGADHQDLLTAYLQRDQEGIERTLVDLYGQDPELLSALRQALTGTVANELAANSLAAKLVDWASDAHQAQTVILVCSAAVGAVSAVPASTVQRTLLGLAKARMDDTTTPDVTALVHFADAIIGQGERASNHFEVLFSTGLSLLNKSLPLWTEKLRVLGLHLAYRARFAEIIQAIPGLTGKEIDQILEVNIDPVWDAIAFIDCVEAGRLALADALLTRLPDEGIPDDLSEIIAAYEAQMHLMRAMISRQDRIIPANLADEKIVLLAKALRGADLKTIHNFIEEIDYSSILLPSGLFGLDALRMALALRDQDLARDLYDRRHGAGLTSWLDGIFQARISLLEGDPERAGQVFAEVLRAADYYGAEDRVEYELILASELSPIQAVWLGHRIDFSRPYQPPQNPLTVHLQSSGTSLKVFSDHTAAFDDHADWTRRFGAHIRHPLPCLILGPVGSGHLALAERLHRTSGRRDEPCLVIPAADAQSTEALAAVGKGTLIIADIENAPLGLMTELEIILQQGRITLDDGSVQNITGKIICTSSLDESALAQRLTPLLRTCLWSLPLILPPLKDRLKHLEPFALGLLESMKGAEGASLGTSCINAFSSYSWPGNLMELRCCLMAMVAVAGRPRSQFTVQDLPAAWHALLVKE